MERFLFICLMSLWLEPLAGNGAMTTVPSDSLTDTDTDVVATGTARVTSLKLAHQQITKVQQSHGITSKSNRVDSILSLTPERVLDLNPLQDGPTEQSTFTSGSAEETEGAGFVTSLKDPSDHLQILSDSQIMEATTRNFNSEPLSVFPQTTRSHTSIQSQADDITAKTRSFSAEPQLNRSESMHSTGVPIKMTLFPSTLETQSVPGHSPDTEVALASVTSPMSEIPGTASTSQMSHLSTGVTKSATNFSTQQTPTKPTENRSLTASTETVGVEVGNSSQTSTASSKTRATAKKQHHTTTMEKKRPGPDPNESDAWTKQEKKGNHGTVVAVLIGGALLMMMVGFLVIYVRKRQLQKQQMVSKDWAGPTPFLDGGDDGQVTLRATNRISFASFLPQRLSKRLSMLQEEDRELEDMTPTSTFENPPPGSTFGKEDSEEDGKESNGTAVLVQDETQTQDASKTATMSTPAKSPETDRLLSITDPSPQLTTVPSAVGNPEPEHSRSSPTQIDQVESVHLPQMENSQEKTLNDSSLSKSDNSIPPPSPFPLPP